MILEEGFHTAIRDVSVLATSFRICSWVLRQAEAQFNWEFKVNLSYRSEFRLEKDTRSDLIHVSKASLTLGIEKESVVQI